MSSYSAKETQGEPPSLTRTDSMGRRRETKVYRSKNTSKNTRGRPRKNVADHGDWIKQHTESKRKDTSPTRPNTRSTKFLKTETSNEEESEHRDSESETEEPEKNGLEEEEPTKEEPEEEIGGEEPTKEAQKLEEETAPEDAGNQQEQALKDPASAHNTPQKRHIEVIEIDSSASEPRDPVISSQEEIESSGSQNTNGSNGYKELQQRCYKLNHQIKQLGIKMRRLEREKSVANKEMDLAKERSSEVHRQFEEQKADWEREKSDLSVQLAEMAQDRVKLLAEMSHMSESTSNLRGEHEDLIQAYAFVSERYNDLKKQYGDLEAANTRICDDLRVLQKRDYEANKKVDALIDETVQQELEEILKGDLTEWTRTCFRGVKKAKAQEFFSEHGPEILGLNSLPESGFFAPCLTGFLKKLGLPTLIQTLISNQFVFQLFEKPFEGLDEVEFTTSMNSGYITLRTATPLVAGRWRAATLQCIDDAAPGWRQQRRDRLKERLLAFIMPLLKLNGELDSTAMERSAASLSEIVDKFDRLTERLHKTSEPMYAIGVEFFRKESEALEWDSGTHGSDIVPYKHKPSSHGASSSGFAAVVIPGFRRPTDKNTENDIWWLRPEVALLPIDEIRSAMKLHTHPSVPAVDMEIDMGGVSTEPPLKGQAIGFDEASDTTKHVDKKERAQEEKVVTGTRGIIEYVSTTVTDLFRPATPSN